MRPIGTPLVALLARSAPFWGRRRTRERYLRKMRATVARLMLANCSVSSAVKPTGSKRARCWAIGSSPGVNRSAQMESRLSHTCTITRSTSSP